MKNNFNNNASKNEQKYILYKVCMCLILKKIFINKGESNNTKFIKYFYFHYDRYIVMAYLYFIIYNLFNN